MVLKYNSSVNSISITKKIVRSKILRLPKSITLGVAY